MSGSLTEEQRRRIEENKRKALAKRAAKLHGSVGQSSVVSTNVYNKPQTGSELVSSTKSFQQDSYTNKTVIPNNNLPSKVLEYKTENVHVGKTFTAPLKKQNEQVSASSGNSNQSKLVANSKFTVPSTKPTFVPPWKSKDQPSSSNGNDAVRLSASEITTNDRKQCTIDNTNIPDLGGNRCAAEKLKQSDSTTNRQRASNMSANSIKSSTACNNAGTKSAIDYNKIEENRLKALARRAEKLNKSPIKPTNQSLSRTVMSATSSVLPSSSSSSLKSDKAAEQPHLQTNQNIIPSKTSSSHLNSAIISSNNNKSNNVNFAQSIHSKSNIGSNSVTNSGISNASNCATNSGTSSSSNTTGQNVFSMFAGTPVKGGCFLVQRDRFEVVIGYSAPLIELFKSMKTKLYDAVTRKWSFKLSEYNNFMTAVRNLKPAVEIEPLTRAILTAFSAYIRGEDPAEMAPIADLSRVEPSLVNSLMPFQREGVNFGIYKNGRVLIADDMGLGKTIQAICLACYYRKEWPVLVVVPSSVRFDWAQNFLRWVPSLDPESVNVVVTGKENCTSGLINILSYDIMARKAEVLRKKRFQVVIMDECHLLKNYKTARCKAASPILQNARRVFLLSGTPAMSRPSELFTQIDAVCPFLFKFHDFGVRYCAGNKMPWGWDYSGSSNMKELQILLEEKIMIRRLKTEVLKELPDKVRKMILLDPGLVKINKDLKQASANMASGNLKKLQEKSALLEFFHKSGSAKMKAVKCYVEDLLECDKKFLIFAHHGDVLDGIEETVAGKNNFNYIRIDGKTSSEQRNVLCRKFQDKDEIKVAILSITAANAGLNLSSACLVVFAELFWNPGILVQAEDRAHRIGQQDMVNVQYLVAKGTSDDHIWPMIQKKLDVLGKAGLSKDNFSTAETTYVTDKRQEEITKFLEESFCEDLARDADETDDREFSSSPRKELKQSSILSYTSPSKELQSSLANTPPRKNQPKGLFKYFSPSKTDNTHTTCEGQSSRSDGVGNDCDLEQFLNESDEEWIDDEPASKKIKR